MVPCEGTFNHSLRNARKDLLSKRFATHKGSNWWIFCWIFIRLSFGSPGSPYCSHARQPPRIAKNEASRALERQKCLSLRCRRKQAVPRCIKAPALSSKITFFFSVRWMLRWVKLWSGRIHEFCSHCFAECAEPPRVYGSRACERKVTCFQLQFHFGGDLWNRRSAGQSILA